MARELNTFQKYVTVPAAALAVSAGLTGCPGDSKLKEKPVVKNPPASSTANPGTGKIPTLPRHDDAPPLTKEEKEIPKELAKPVQGAAPKKLRRVLTTADRATFFNMSIQQAFMTARSKSMTIGPDVRAVNVESSLRSALDHAAKIQDDGAENTRVKDALLGKWVQCLNKLSRVLGRTRTQNLSFDFKSKFPGTLKENYGPR